MDGETSVDREGRTGDVRRGTGRQESDGRGGLFRSSETAQGGSPFKLAARNGPSLERRRHELGLDIAGRDGIYPDPELCPLDGQAANEPLDAGLGGAVGGPLVHAEPPRDRRDTDERAPRRGQCVTTAPCAPERAAEVDIDQTA